MLWFCNTALNKTNTNQYKTSDIYNRATSTPRDLNTRGCTDTLHKLAPLFSGLLREILHKITKLRGCFFVKMDQSVYFLAISTTLFLRIFKTSLFQCYAAIFTKSSKSGLPHCMHMSLLTVKFQIQAFRFHVPFKGLPFSKVCW